MKGIDKMLFLLHFFFLKPFTLFLPVELVVQAFLLLFLPFSVVHP